MELKSGDKVTYVTPYKKEKGIVKSVPDDRHAFVVYNCEDDWDSYENYTAARTRIEDLKPGWRGEE